MPENRHSEQLKFVQYIPYDHTNPIISPMQPGCTLTRVPESGTPTGIIWYKDEIQKAVDLVRANYTRFSTLEDNFPEKWQHFFEHYDVQGGFVSLVDDSSDIPEGQSAYKPGLLIFHKEVIGLETIAEQLQLPKLSELNY